MIGGPEGGMTRGKSTGADPNIMSRPQPIPDSPKRLRSVSSAPRFASVRSIMALILREMTTSYGRSPGGYIWAVLEPALGIFFLVLIFSTGFRSPPLGTNFAIFYASGILPFFVYVNLSGKVSQALNYSKQLLAYPRVSYIDAILARFILSLLTQLLVSYVIFTVILTNFETRTALDISELALAYVMAASLGFSIGVANAVMMMRFPLWQPVWSVVNRPLILISGVIFLHDNIPSPYREWLEWNPLIHVTGQARKAFYYSYTGEYVDPMYVFGLCLVCSLFGLVFLRRYYRDFFER